MNIVLIGYRGTGKSSVGRLVAEALGRDYISTDDGIEERIGTSIASFVEDHGWERFRDEETTVIREVAARESAVLDTGGGAVLREENVALLKAKGWLCWLWADGATIRERIGAETQRPSLTGGKSFFDEVEDVLAERTPLYEGAAQHKIKTAGRSLGDIAAEVVTAAQKYGIV
jgi:shikimate kinase